jgi:hypothetical protein
MTHTFGMGAKEMINIVGSQNLEPFSWIALDGAVGLLGTLL